MTFASILLLALLAAPAAAETWDCRLTERCDTTERCVTLDNQTATLTIAADGKTASFAAGSEAVPFRALLQDGETRHFITGPDEGMIGFISLAADGSMAMSAHLTEADLLSALASTGTCTRTAQ